MPGSVQVVLDVLWPGVSSGVEAFGTAAIVIVVLVRAVAGTIHAFARADRLVAWLLAPYLLWLTCAAARDIAIWSAN